MSAATLVSVARVLCLTTAQICICVFALVILCVPRAGAQNAGAEPPEISIVDANQVDMVRGLVRFDMTDLSIGDENFGGLTYVRSFVHRGFRDNFVGTLQSYTPPVPRGVSRYFTVSIGGMSDMFQEIPVSADRFRNKMHTGSTLTFDTGTQLYTYRTANGLTAIFSAALAGAGANEGLLTSLTYPMGEQVTLHYLVIPTTGGHLERLQSVTNNLGHQLHFEYALNGYTNGDALMANIPLLSAWRRRVKVTGINNAVEHCAPLTEVCSLAQNWPAVTYGYGASTETVTNALGHATTFTYVTLSGRPYLASIQRPSSATPITFTYGTFNTDNSGASVRVASVSNGVATWTYQHTQDPPPAQEPPGSPDPEGGTRTTTVTNPVGGTGGTRIYRSVFGLEFHDDALNEVVDELGRTTQYYFSLTGGGLVATSYPEGNRIDYQRDARGNVTQVTITPKPGSGQPQLVSTAVYDTTCANQITCNLPHSITDFRGNTTEFTYDPAHGGVLTETGPAPTIGAVRPQTRYGYTSHFAWYRNSSGSIVQAPASVTRQTSTSRCRTLASCANTADEHRTNTAFPVGSSTLATNLMPLSTTTASGDAAIVATSTFSYDNVGNLISVDGPISGTSDTIYSRYDLARRLVGVIQSDPDGPGGQPRTATRTAYNADGRVTLEETGTVAGVTDTDWNAFVSREQHATQYDSVGRVALSSLAGGGQTFQVTQTSYDVNGRVDCVAVRMNPNEFSQLPASACTLDTEGAQGADRISRTIYNAASQPTAQISALGLPLLEQTTRTLQYTPNGRVDWIEDANGNRSDYEYDAYDRLYRLYFPSTTVGTHAANPADYEQYGYDQAGNITSVRRRSGEVIANTFDALNRQTIRDIPGGNTEDVYAEYDLFGNALSSRHGSTSGAGVVNTFDSLSRLLTTTSFGLSLSYQYDNANRRTRMTWSDGNYVDYAHDVLSRIDQIRLNGATVGLGLLADYSYDELGRTAGVVFGNGTTQTLSYDGISRLSTTSHNVSGTQQDLTVGFSYNSASQLIARTQANTLYALPIASTISTSYVRDGLNRYSAVGGISFSYSDGRGNLTSDGSRSLVYDIDNRLRTMSGPASLALGYDPLGRLREAVGATTTRFLYDRDALVAEFDGSANFLRRYVHGPGIDDPLVWFEGTTVSAPTWLHADERGSIVATTDTSGAASIYSYSPYGEPGNDNWTGSRFRYTGQIILPEARLYHFKARAYDPRLGRFLQTDPAGYADQMNLYAYGRNDPLSRIDPNGRDSIEVHFRDQPIRYPEDFPIRELRGQTMYQSMSGGHSAIVAIDEGTGLTRYREFGRYNGGSEVRSQRVPNLDFRNGKPTGASLRALLTRIMEIGAANDSSNIWITFDAGTDFDRMMDYVETVQEDQPEWAPFGPNCHTFCAATGRAGGGRGPRFTAPLTPDTIDEVVERIDGFYPNAKTESDCRVTIGSRICR